MQLSHTGEGVIILSCGFAHTTEEILRNKASVCNTSKTTFTEACKQAKKHLGVNTSKDELSIYEQLRPTRLDSSDSYKDSEVPEVRWDKRTLPSSMCGHMELTLSNMATRLLTAAHDFCFSTQPFVQYTTYTDDTAAFDAKNLYWIFSKSEEMGGLIVSIISVDNVVKLVSLQYCHTAEQTRVHLATKLSGPCMSLQILTSGLTCYSRVRSWRRTHLPLQHNVGDINVTIGKQGVLPAVRHDHVMQASDTATSRNSNNNNNGGLHASVRAAEATEYSSPFLVYLCGRITAPHTDMACIQVGFSGFVSLHTAACISCDEKRPASNLPLKHSGDRPY
ncbi:hypothetical protein DPX16_13655 [Anabarilius grahami]|uniref:Uncharacterized protein n=1 Tax=Anabarilius grahami TaxID=495550 RepID=A0A3N0XTX1_ANAGA|nr:hypothetical protein DPX16_13655 [Anabarilius grahami]